LERGWGKTFLVRKKKFGRTVCTGLKIDEMDFGIYNKIYRNKEFWLKSNFERKNINF
jgi:hypothetical protein